MSEIMINVSQTFTKMPCVRNRDDGDFSGQEFREDVLIPALKSDSKVIVDLRGVLALGSSFLDEAFAGLVRNHGFTARELHNRMEIRFELQSYIDDIWRRIDSARRA